MVRVARGLVSLVCLLGLAMPIAASAGERVASRRIDELDLSRTTLDGAFEVLRDRTHANIVVRWPALEAAGVERTTPIRLRLWDVTLATALNVLLDASTDPMFPLGWSEEDGVITVSTREQIDQMYVGQVYDVRDLLLALGATPHRPEASDQIIRLITENVAPDSWRDAGGTTGSIREVGLRLIVAQSPQNQVKVRQVLARLREEFSKPMPVTTRPAATAPADGESLLGDARFYDVRDLLSALTDADAQGGRPHTRFEIEAQLVGVILNHVMPDSWDRRDGVRGVSNVGNGVSVIAGRLVVTQSPEGHEMLKRFLAEMRRELLHTAPNPSASSPRP